MRGASKRGTRTHRQESRWSPGCSDSGSSDASHATAATGVTAQTEKVEHFARDWATVASSVASNNLVLSTVNAAYDTEIGKIDGDVTAIQDAAALEATTISNVRDYENWYY